MISQHILLCKTKEKPRETRNVKGVCKKKDKNKPRPLDGVVGFMMYAQVYLEKAFQILLMFLEQSNLSGIRNK